MQVKIFGLACLMLLSTVVFGQKSMTDKTHDLDEVVVKSTKLQDYAVGSNVQKVDSLEKERFATYSMADLLASVSLANINSYGPGGLSNATIRGGTSAQTAVIWNGVNIQSPMNGGVDMAQLPSQFFGDISIQYGGSGTLFGSGASAGAIHLGEENLFATKNNVGLKLSYGSFETRNVLFSVKSGDSKLSNSFKYFYNQANNDFDYVLADDSEFKQTNAGLKQHAVINETQIKTGSNSILKATVWYQQYEKESQTEIGSDPSDAIQEDKDLKLALNWNLAKEQFNLKAKSVYVYNDNYYENPSLGSAATNISKMWVNEVDGKYRINKNHSIIGGLNLTYEEAISGDYMTSLERRARLSIFASYKIENILNRITWVNSFRQEMVDGDLSPFIFSSGLSAKIIDPVTLNANISRIYRLPTFNDLYWSESSYGYTYLGNPDLEAEKGWSLDAGLEENFKINTTTFKLKQNFFWNHIKNWMAWVSDDTYLNWWVENKDEGKTIGIDFAAEMNLKLSSSANLFVNAAYTWIESNYVEIVAGEEYESKITYVPKHHFLINVGIQQKKWNIIFTQKYVDYRSAGFYGNMEPYFVENLSGQYTFPLGKQSLTAALQINNIWDRYYQVIYGYAMPGRNFKFSLYYNLNL